MSTQRSEHSAIFFVQQFDTFIYNQMERISFQYTSVLFESSSLLVVFVSITFIKTPPYGIQLVFFLRSYNRIKIFSLANRSYSEFCKNALHLRLDLIKKKLASDFPQIQQQVHSSSDSVLLINLNGLRCIFSINIVGYTISQCLPYDC